MSDRLLAGVDVGGSKISALIADPELHVLGRVTVPTTDHGSAAVVERIAEVVEGALPRSDGAAPQLAGVGVGIPGRVETSTGHVSLAVNLQWADLGLGELLSRRLGAPVFVENDVRAAASAVHELGLLGAHHSLAYLSVGTGIAAGVVLDGRLWRGAHGLAGEIGHLVVRPGGPVCACGQHGCLEALASARSIARRAETDIAAGRITTLQPPIGARDVFVAAAAGDVLASTLAEEAGDLLAWAVQLLVMTYDVEVVALGGGAAQAGRDFADPILRGIERRRSASPLAREVLHGDIVRLLPPDAEPGTWGALLLARRGTDHPG